MTANPSIDRTATASQCLPFMSKVTQARQMESYIDNYLGEWSDPYGRRLRIIKVTATTASVSLFAEHQPLARLWYESRPSSKWDGKWDVGPKSPLLGS